MPTVPSVRSSTRHCHSASPSALPSGTDLDNSSVTAVDPRLENNLITSEKYPKRPSVPFLTTKKKLSE